MKLTVAAILVSRGMKVLQAAPAAYPDRSAAEHRLAGRIWHMVRHLTVVILLVEVAAAPATSAPAHGPKQSTDPAPTADTRLARVRDTLDLMTVRARVYARVYYRIAVAPKLVYRLDKLVVYRDGVWAEYWVTNPGPERTYLADRWAVPPISLKDSGGREWDAPKFDGCVLFGPVNNFVAVPAGEAVRFRSRLSHAEGPLEPVGRAKLPAATNRPTELAYTAAGWGYAYTRQTGGSRCNVYAVGGGKVPVKWIDAPAPKSWGFHIRLYCDES